jgi:hypothetical protein
MFHLPVQVCFSHSAFADDIVFMDRHVTQGVERQVVCRSRNTGRWQTWAKKLRACNLCSKNARTLLQARHLSRFISPGTAL